ncbi:unnamed protein product [Owenia fusiformis]|uniref:Uncharacterized protein n=1 Tax=Owenia fusiformis TaxID=6347 RepID=A0A8J1U3M2_OWEFU|nr:unnamed protein product [Owenia fusiformis]
MEKETKRLIESRPAPDSTSAPLFHDSSQSPTAKRLQYAFVGIVVIMVLISIGLSIYRGAVTGVNNGLYFMLGISLIGFVVIEIFLIRFIRNEDLPKEKSWFLYFVGACVILEAIFTNVLLFDEN